MADFPDFTNHLKELSQLKALLKDTYIDGEYRHLMGSAARKSGTIFCFGSYETGRWENGA